MADWNREKVETVPSLLTSALLASQREPFLEWYGKTKSALLDKPLHVRPIINETTGGTDCYQDFAGVVSVIANTMLLPDLKVTTFTNAAASSKQRPDIMVVLHKTSVSATTVLFRCTTQTAPLFRRLVLLMLCLLQPL